MIQKSLIILLLIDLVGKNFFFFLSGEHDLLVIEYFGDQENENAGGIRDRGIFSPARKKEKLSRNGDCISIIFDVFLFPRGQEVRHRSHSLGMGSGFKSSDDRLDMCTGKGL